MINNIFIPKQVALVPLFLIIVLGFLPVVDNLTGAMFKLAIISEGAVGSPSQLARFALFGLVIWLINKSNYVVQLKFILTLTCYLLCVESIYAVLHFTIKAYLYGIIFTIKVLFAVSCFLFISSWISGSKERTVYVIKQLVNYGTIVALLVLAAYFSGFHISNYKVGIATRGLFISGNGLGIVLGVSTLLLVYFTNSFKSINSIRIILLLLTTALLGTKASLLFVTLATLLLLVKLIKRAPIITVLLLSILGFYILVPAIEILGDVFENIIYKFNKIDDKIHFFASSRDKFIKEAFEQISFEGFYAFRLIFGGSAYYSYLDSTNGAEIFRKSLENDLFELFFAYGLVLVIPFISLYFYALFKTIKTKNYIIGLITSLVFFHSITMGHVIFNGTSAISFALCLALSVKGSKVTKHDF